MCLTLLVRTLKSSGMRQNRRRAFPVSARQDLAQTLVCLHRPPQCCPFLGDPCPNIVEIVLSLSLARAFVPPPSMLKITATNRNGNDAASSKPFSIEAASGAHEPEEANFPKQSRWTDRRIKATGFFFESTSAEHLRHETTQALRGH